MADAPATLLEALRATEAAIPAGIWHRHTYGHATTGDAASAAAYAVHMTADDLGVPATDLSYVHVAPDGDEGPPPRIAAITGNGAHSVENAEFLATWRNGAPMILQLLAQLEAYFALPGDTPEMLVEVEAAFDKLRETAMVPA